MEAIAARAGIPKTTLYKRFSDKGDLLDAVLRERVAAWERIASRQHSSTTNDLRERLYRHISMMMIWGTKPEVQVVMRLAASAYGLSGRPFARRSFFAYDHMVNLLARAIAELGPTQNIHARDPNRVALALMAFVSGWLESREGMAPATPDDIDAEATLVVNLMIDGAAAW